jgi:hypothetical protein
MNARHRAETVKCFSQVPLAGIEIEEQPAAGRTARNKMNKNRPIAILTVACMLTALSGCGDAGRTVADWLDPPSAAEITARVQEQARQGDLRLAIATGEAYVRRHPDIRGALRVELARLHTELGDTDRAVDHLERSHETGASPAPEPAAAPDVPATPAAAPAPPVQAAVPAASASVDGDAVQAQAGGVIARVPR